MTKKNPKIDAFLRRAKKWRDELTELRRITLDCGLTEELKWYQPCYTVNDKNVIILGGFKDHCVLSFVKGALLKDPKNILITPGPNSQSVRTIQFMSVQEIAKLEPVLQAYIDEAVEVEKNGLKVNLKKITQRKIPEELADVFDENPAFKAAFQKLTPGRQRGYYMYISSAKQSKTRESRVQKCMPQILKGKGLND
jgi:uncharacterized protein YdeI (YjbR/CyaY-like superfamily)